MFKIFQPKKLYNKATIGLADIFDPKNVNSFLSVCSHSFLIIAQTDFIITVIITMSISSLCGYKRNNKMNQMLRQASPVTRGVMAPTSITTVFHRTGTVLRCFLAFLPSPFFLSAHFLLLALMQQSRKRTHSSGLMAAGGVLHTHGGGEGGWRLVSLNAWL